jgi:hypothetical protein
MAARFAVAWAGISLLLLLVSALSAGATVTSASDINVSGYAQARVNFQQDVAPASSFIDKRLYMNLDAKTGTDTKVGVLLTGFPKYGVLKAFVEKDQIGKKDSTIYRMGLFSTPFGYEAGLSSASLITLERSKGVSELVYKPWSFDNGLFMNYTKKGLSAAVGLTNGEKMDATKGLPSNGDTNNVKNVTARIGKKSGDTTVGASALYGADGDLQVYGVDAMMVKKDLTVIGEAIMGDDCSTKSNGFYVTAAQTGNDINPYARFDTYDANTDIAGGQYYGVTIGASHMLNPMTKESFEIQNNVTKAVVMETSSAPVAKWTATFQLQGRF